MGDFISNGEKIGTTGTAYYTTKEMLEKLSGSQLGADGKYYLDSKNNCSFAFPFPEFDNKKVGSISIFHKEERDFFQIRLKREGAKTHHKEVVFHKHPAGSQGVNFYCNCPYHEEAKTSVFTEQYIKFHLKYQQFFQGELAIAGECIFCGCTNLFEKHEAIEAAGYLVIEADFIDASEKPSSYQQEEAKLKREVAKRIIATYENNI